MDMKKYDKEDISLMIMLLVAFAGCFVPFFKSENFTRYMITAVDMWPIMVFCIGLPLVLLFLVIRKKLYSKMMIRTAVVLLIVLAILIAITIKIGGDALAIGFFMWNGGLAIFSIMTLIFNRRNNTLSK